MCGERLPFLCNLEHPCPEREASQKHVSTSQVTLSIGAPPPPILTSLRRRCHRRRPLSIELCCFHFGLTFHLGLLHSQIAWYTAQLEVHMIQSSPPACPLVGARAVVRNKHDRCPLPTSPPPSLWYSPVTPARFTTCRYLRPDSTSCPTLFAP